MPTLLSLLEQESRRRDLLAANETLTAASSFALVRDMLFPRTSWPVSAHPGGVRRAARKVTENNLGYVLH